MKEDPFIIKFLEGVLEMVSGIGDVWARTPYKGFSPNRLFKSDYKKKYYQGFKNLEKRGFIKSTKNDNFVFTVPGRQWLNKSFNRYLHQWGPWDKKWRVIIFDIPQEMHRERLKLRYKLKSFGCIMLQKSVFVFPYNCGTDLAEICQDLGVNEYVDIILAESIGSRDQELKKIFELN